MLVTFSVNGEPSVGGTTRGERGIESTIVRMSILEK